MRAALAAILCLCAAMPAIAGVRSVSISDPRPFGHFVGDIIRRHAEITVDANDELVAASIPRRGPVNYWLDLNKIDVSRSERGGERHYLVDLWYQAFYVPLEPKRMTIPAVTLQFKTADGAPAATLGPFRFTMSPLRELIAEKSEDGSAFALRPDALPQLVPTAKVRAAMIASAAVAMMSIVLLARHLAWGPFRRRAGRPFTEAAREIRTRAGENGGAAGYRRGLLALHRAFDASAGRRLLADDLGRFLATQPRLDADKADIVRFFESSRQVFFADNLSAGIATLPPSALGALAARLAQHERAGP